MAFDAFMLRAVINELQGEITSARVEKVLQPSKDEIILLLHKGGKNHRLVINAGGSAPRIGLSAESPENPKAPPMFCMLLRKHLTGSKIKEISHHGFERVAEIVFEGYDELGFMAEKSLICEIMGRVSNIILCDSDKKIISALKIIDFSTSVKRQLLPQMLYEAPPSQDKRNPLEENFEEFSELLKECENFDEKFLVSRYLGMSPLTAREIVYLSGGEKDANYLWQAFDNIRNKSLNHSYTPTLIKDKNGKEIDFSPFAVKQYKSLADTFEMNSFADLTDAFYAKRERDLREKQRAASVIKTLGNAEARLIKKLDTQRAELKDTEKRSEYKYKADLITANIYRLKDRASSVTLIDYGNFDEDGEYSGEKEVVIKLDEKLTAAQNAQRLYKKYNKAKNAEYELSKQIREGERELVYIRSVQDALSRINGQVDLEEIQRELLEGGYMPKIKKELSEKKGRQKQTKNPERNMTPLKFQTTDGFVIYVGKNNLQNDYLTFKSSDKSDYWFHVKNRPGSHVILSCNGKEPTQKAIVEAAQYAARNSKGNGDDRVEVDYTKVKNVKKPSGSKPGYVIYDSYSTIIVSGIE